MKKNILVAAISALVTFSNAGTVNDSRDGRSYTSVSIGRQIWLAENMKFVTKNSSCYDHNPRNCEMYGRLYTWDDAMNVCPEGFRLPENSDFEELKKYIESKVGSEKAGDVLKMHGYGESYTSVNFEMPLAGNKVGSTYKFLDETAYLWTATEEDEDRAYDWVLSANSSDFVQGNVKYALKKNAFSVRCIKNEKIAPVRYGKFRDERDDRIYRTVKIGKRTWFAENLDYKTPNSKCRQDDRNCRKFGTLYNWNEANTLACPRGTHLPSRQEFAELFKNDVESLVDTKEQIVFVDCPDCSTGCYGICFEVENVEVAFKKCMTKCEMEGTHERKLIPSNSTGFSAVLFGDDLWADAEGWGSEPFFAYWNSTDLKTTRGEDENEICVEQNTPVLSASTSLSSGDSPDCLIVEKKLKRSYFPVRCVLD